MSRLQRILKWVGNICMALGVIFSLIAVPWRLVLAVTDKRTIGSTANILLLVGFLIFFSGFFIFRMSMKKEAKKG